MSNRLGTRSSIFTDDWRRDHSYQRIYDYLHDSVGCSQKQRLMDDLCDFLYFEKLGWAYKNHVKFSPEVSLVTVTEPDTGEIIEIGGSLPSDIFVDQFGSLLGAFYRQPVNGSAVLPGTIKDVTNTNQTCYIWNTAPFFIHVGGQVDGTKMQLGSGSTAPARADVGIQTALSTAPENALFSTGAGSYTGGTTTVSGSITSGGTGTINEGIVVIAGNNSVGTVVNICQIHDALTSTPFTASKSLTMQTSVTD